MIMNYVAISILYIQISVQGDVFYAYAIFQNNKKIFQRMRSYDLNRQ